MGALGVFDLGARPYLYMGGWFGLVDGRWVPGIARLDGDAGWVSVGGGTDAGVNCFIQFDDGTGAALYVGGEFGTAGGISAGSVAKWDGANWSPLGNGLQAGVNALAVFDDGSGPALYAGGYFVWSKPKMTRYIARWDGKSWSQVGTLSSAVHALRVWDDGTGPALYAGGEFKTADGKPAIGIAKWDGKGWSAVGKGAEGSVWCLALFDDGTGEQLYAGGNGVHRWNGQEWSVVSGIDDAQHPVAVLGMTVHDDGRGPALYLGGSRSVDADRLALLLRWDGATVEELALGHGVYGTSYIEALAFAPPDDGSLFAGGHFADLNGVPMTHFGKYTCTPCPADCDASGDLDLFDYLCFINAFNAAADYADCDAGGGLDLFDFLCFNNVFNEGC